MLNQTSLIIGNEKIDLRSYSSENITHTHEYSQWVLALNGTLELEIDRHTRIIDSNVGAFIAPGESHSYLSHDQNLFLILDVPHANSFMAYNIIPAFWRLTPTLQEFLKFAKFYLTQNLNDIVSNQMVKDFLVKLLTKHFLSDYDFKVMIAKTGLTKILLRQ